jgi:hypothetical protein
MTNNLTSKTSPEEWADRISAAWRKVATHTIETGRLLIEAKGELAHGEWLEMRKRLPFGRSVTERLMAIAGHPVLAKTDHGPLLPASYQTLYALTKVPEPRLLAAIADGTITPRMERKDVVVLREPQLRPRPSPKARPTPENAAAASSEDERKAAWDVIFRTGDHYEVTNEFLWRAKERWSQEVLASFAAWILKTCCSYSEATIRRDGEPRFALVSRSRWPS